MEDFSEKAGRSKLPGATLDISWRCGALAAFRWYCAAGAPRLQGSV